MTYPACLILHDGLQLDVTGITEAGPLVRKETRAIAFLSLRGPKKGTYSGKLLDNGMLILYAGCFQHEIAKIKTDWLGQTQ